MTKAFSLLELIIVILVLAIILTFAISKYDNILNNTNFTKLKSDFALIQNGISNNKRRNILLGSIEKNIILDNAVFMKKGEYLFSNVLDFSIISTNDSKKEKGKWLKLTSSSYEFFLSSNNKVLFTFEDNIFSCKSPIEICKDLQ